MSDAYIYDGGRSAFGRHGGALSSVRPDDLLGHVIKTLVQRNDFDSALYEDVIAGATNQAGEDCRNVARFAGLLAGLPITAGGQTVNRLCGSGMAAALDATRCVKVGEGDLFIAGGVESMSRAPLVLSKATSAFDRSQEIADTTLGARFTNPKIAEQFGADTIGAGYQYWFPVASGKFTKCAKAAKASHDFRATGAFCHMFDAFDQLVARIDVDAGVFIAERRACCRGLITGIGHSRARACLDVWDFTRRYFSPKSPGVRLKLPQFALHWVIYCTLPE